MLRPKSPQNSFYGSYLPQAGGTALQDVKHTWDAGGNLAAREDVLASQTETFSYDFLDRLTGVSGPYTESFSYNQIGNMMSKNGVSYTYSTKPHAVTAVGSTSYTYDSNGNMLTRGSDNISWDVDNRPVMIATANVTATFVYDGDGNRVRKVDGGVITVYINKYFEKSSTENISNYFLGGKLVAIREGTTLKYIHQDHLTGTSLVTSDNGTQLGTTMKYLPFGGARSGSVATDKLFTGQRLDGTGLYYYGARYYDPSIGRFISPDPLSQISPSSTDMQLSLSVSYLDAVILNKIGQAYRDGGYYKGGVFNPQLLNRYSYAGNNPLKYADSSGHFWVIIAAAIGACAGVIAYGMTHENDFQIGEALAWTAIGTVSGATLGLGAEWAAGSLAARGAAVSSAAASLPFAYRVVQSIQPGNTGKIGHIMQARHCWNLIAKSFDEVQLIMQRVIQSVDMAATGEFTRSGAPIFQYTSQVKGYNVLVQAYYDVQASAWVLVDGWVVVP